MKSTCVTALALVLFSASMSLAFINDTQVLDNHSTNGLLLPGGPGVADSVNIGTAGMIQQNQDVGGLVRTVQTQNAGLVQAAGAGGIGFFGVGQQACLLGVQNQLHLGGPFNLGANNQIGGIGLSQGVAQPGPGVGLAFGLQQAFLNQFQITATPFGTSVNATPVTATVFDAVSN